MAIESVLRNTSRRALLAGLAGGLAAGVAGALGRASPALAVDGDVHLNVSNDSTALTTIHNTATRGSAFYGQATGTGDGVSGSTDSGFGVSGSSAEGFGVFASSLSGTALYAISDLGYGLQASGGSETTPAALGWSTGSNTGLQGVSGAGFLPISPAKTGVYGYAVQDSSARGVTGETTVGRGVQGIATSGVGLYGTAAASGTALQAAGRVAFSTSGLASVAVGTKSMTVSPGTDLVGGSKILCTLESNQIGLLIHRVTKDTAANTFKVFLSANVLSGRYAKVAWFVIG